MRHKTVVALLVALATACGSSKPETADLRAFGNEPFWNVILSANDGIVYGRLGEADISFPYQAPREAVGDPTSLVFGPVRDSTRRHQIEVQVTDLECPDTMADAIHPMRARVILDGEELLGCARALDEAPPGERP